MEPTLENAREATKLTDPLLNTEYIVAGENPTEPGSCSVIKFGADLSSVFLEQNSTFKVVLIRDNYVNLELAKGITITNVTKDELAKINVYI